MASDNRGRRGGWPAAWLASALLLCVALIHTAQAPSRGLPDSAPVVARIYYQQPADLARLTNVDVWEYHNVAEGYGLAAVTGPDLHALRAAGWRVVVDERATADLAGRADEPAFNNGYRSVDEIYAALDTAAAAYPDLTELLDYGQSHCLAISGCTTPGGDALDGFPLRAIRVTNEAVAGTSQVDGTAVTRGQKPVFFLMAGIHAREITTPEIALRFLDMLLEGYGRDADITWLVDWHETWIVPAANPDGHWLVALGDSPAYSGWPFMQRKNARQDNDDDGTVDCPVWPPDSGVQFGVDLNRNHSFAWGGVGSDDTPCSPVYRGVAASSESEVAALEALLRALVADQRGPELSDPAPDDAMGMFITLHSFSELVLWPWGHADIEAPNKADLRAIGDRLASLNGYRSCQAAALDCLYPSAGASDDWVYAELGIPAFTFEIGREFMPSYAEIDATQWPANAPALRYAAAIARAPYELVHGPEASGVVVGGPGPIHILSATLGSGSSGSPIAAAEYTVDVPPWDASAQSVALVAADGAFDEALETVTASVDSATLIPGRHTIYLRGQDSDGNWGPVSAAFLSVGLQTPVTRLYLPGVLRP